MLEFYVSGRGHGKTFSMKESIKKQFECGCMSDDLLDSMLSQGSSLEEFECIHGVSIQFGRRGKHEEVQYR